MTALSWQGTCAAMTLPKQGGVTTLLSVAISSTISPYTPASRVSNEEGENGPNVNVVAADSLASETRLTFLWHPFGGPISS